MKVLTKVVIDIETGLVEEEEFFDYDGPIAEAFGGGSSGGGSSTQGANWPEYMKGWHGKMLQAVWDIIQVEQKSVPPTFWYDPRIWFGFPTNQTPYALLPAYNAQDIDLRFRKFFDVTDSSYLSFGYARALVWEARVEELWADFVAGTTQSTAIGEAIDAFTAKIAVKIDQDVIPKIELGFRDAGACVGTGYTIAKAQAMGEYTRQVADFTAKMRLHFHDQRAEFLKLLTQQEPTWKDFLVNTSLKRASIILALEKDKLDYTLQLAGASVMGMGKYSALQTEDAIRQRTYKLDLHDHMNKTLASISGAATARQGESRASQVFNGVLGGISTGVSAISQIAPMFAGGSGGAAAGFAGATATTSIASSGFNFAEVLALLPMLIP